MPGNVRVDDRIQYHRRVLCPKLADMYSQIVILERQIRLGEHCLIILVSPSRSLPLEPVHLLAVEVEDVVKVFTPAVEKRALHVDCSA